METIAARTFCCLRELEPTWRWQSSLLIHGDILHCNPCMYCLAPFRTPHVQCNFAFTEHEGWELIELVYTLQSPQKGNSATRFTIPRHPMGATSSGSPCATGFAACRGRLQHAVHRLNHFKLAELRITSSVDLRTLWVLTDYTP